MSNLKNLTSKAAETTAPRALHDIMKKTGNVYRSIVIASKRSNQIGQELKEELHSKLEEFASHNDNLEEVFENREQIEISKYYERLPNPALLAMEEFMEDEIYFRDPEEEAEDAEA